jgi:two-component system NtrC family response regulator
MPKKIAVVDDDKNLAKMLAYILEEQGHEVVVFHDAPSCQRYLHEHDCDLVITDLQMPNGDGMQLLSEVKKYHPDVVLVIITAFGTVERAVEAMKRGAYDFITKPIDNEELVITVNNALRFGELLAENRHLRDQLSEKYSLDQLVGKSLAMQQVYTLVRKVAKSDANVLITGETGTGKELVARAIHYNSQRRDKPFMAVDCSTIPKDLVASELFGHRKGSFTGAIRDKKGKFELANGGTLFLDEIGDVPLETQVKLLRVLQQRTITPLGDERDVPVDVRIIAATNRDLQAAIEAGEFRQDLYYRLNVFPIELPPLRQRREDIPLLVEHFLTKFAPGKQVTVTPKAFELLTQYHWSGNVRELENVVERALILSEGGDIYPEHLPDSLKTSSRPGNGLLDIEIPDEGISLEDLEKDLLQKALRKAGGNQTRAAELLGITRHTLIYRLEKYGLTPKP